jgi:hypothetical protein
MDETRLLLTDGAWATIAAALNGLKSRRGAPPALSDRDFAEAVLALARTGTPGATCRAGSASGRRSTSGPTAGSTTTPGGRCPARAWRR